MKKIILGLALLLGISLHAHAAPDANAGKKMSAGCSACHGMGGNSIAGTWPKLAGQHEKYILKALKAYKLGEKGGRDNKPIMYGMAAPLSEQDLENLAAYFATQTRTIGKTDPALFAAGQAIYRGGNLKTGLPACMACHGPTGEGNAEAGFPSLSGQHAEYVVNVLKQYKSGERHDDTSAIMQNISKMMSDDDMKAVASYVQGLH